MSEISDGSLQVGAHGHGDVEEVALARACLYLSAFAQQGQRIFNMLSCLRGVIHCNSPKAPTTRVPDLLSGLVCGQLLDARCGQPDTDMPTVLNLAQALLWLDHLDEVFLEAIADVANPDDGDYSAGLTGTGALEVWSMHTTRCSHFCGRMQTVALAEVGAGAINVVVVEAFWLRVLLDGCLPLAVGVHGCREQLGKGSACGKVAGCF